MANILLADTKVYGKAENINAFLDILKGHLYFTTEDYSTDFDGNIVQRDLKAEFRWNIERTLTKPEILEATKKYHIGIEAMGYEPGIGFYEVVSVQFGKVLDSQSINLVFNSAYFYPYDEVNENET